jgi:hypothetical protein
MEPSVPLAKFSKSGKLITHYVPDQIPIYQDFIYIEVPVYRISQRTSQVQSSDMESQTIADGNPLLHEEVIPTRLLSRVLFSPGLAFFALLTL